MKDVKGKTAVVTGAASGIGFALAERFASLGMNVVLADYDAASLDVQTARLASAGHAVLGVPTDVSVSTEIEALAARTEDKFGPVHVLVNNAGVGGAGGPLWSITENDWKWTLGVNLWGVLHGLRVFVPRMLAHGGEGHIVNTASIAGVLTPPFMGDYVATKHAVVGISETLARDLQAFGSPLGVSVLCPGFIQTGIAESARHRPDHLKNPPLDGAAAGARDMMIAAVKQLVANGKPVAVVADAVMNAIHNRVFHIFTHDELWPAVEERFSDLRERRYPRFDPATFATGKA